MTCYCPENLRGVTDGFSKCTKCLKLWMHGEACIGGDGYGDKCSAEADVETISPIDPEELCVMIAELREEVEELQSRLYNAEKTVKIYRDWSVGWT